MMVPKVELDPRPGEPFFTREFKDFLKDGLAESVQNLTAVLVGFCVFAGCWLHAINSWGWLLGIAFGWIPSAVITVAVGWIAYKLWFVIVGLVTLIVWQIMI